MSEVKNKFYCNSCQQYTWHLTHGFINKKYVEESGYYEDTDYFFAECCGCEMIKMVVLVSNPCNRDINGEYIPDETIYPPKTIRRLPRWIYDLSGDFVIDDPKVCLLREIYNALQNQCPRLAVMGIRALVEYLMIEKSGDQGRFSDNIKKFEQDGYISKQQRSMLDLVLEAGHATIHRSFKPTEDQALVALDIAENIIESIYINKDTGTEKLKNIPPKPKKTR